MKSALIDEFSRLWSSGSPPDVVSFLQGHEQSSIDDKLGVALVDQAYRWKTPSPLLVEDYVAACPVLGTNGDARLQLAISEFQSRLGGETKPNIEDYTARFADLREPLQSKLSQLVSRASGGPSAISETTTLAGAAKPAHREPLSRPERIGRYRPLRLLGHGAFGVVWLAYDDELRREVAIKVPSARQFSSEDEKESFLAEARTLAALDHPHVLPVYDVGRTEDGSVYVVSKFVEGCTLAQRLSDLPPSTEEAIHIISEMAAALAHAHERGLIHRDIKPANILLEAGTGRAYLADFGLALGLGDAREDGLVAGTPSYMSPEQARGELARLDARSDIFSLGIVLYELLTGKKPFAGSTATEVFEQIEHDAPRRPRDWQKSLDEQLEGICLTALAKSPDERYQSAANFAAALGSWRRRQTTPNNLPAESEPLIGRDRETSELAELLKASRLVTLTGPGGVGKTRLALAAARAALGDFPDGVYFVELAALRDAALVPSAIAQVLECREAADRPLVAAIIERLANKQLLLVIDNFEHLPAAADVVGKLLAGAEGFRILVTSRAPLRLAGEHEYPVPLLALPPPGLRGVDSPLEFPAVALFVQRAKSALPSFELTSENTAAVVEICAQMEGLPLAIELAAARVKVLSPAGLVERLRNRLSMLTGGRKDLPARQQTLRQAIAWSYDLLDVEEQRILCRMAVFAGGATLEAAEAIVTGEGESLDVLSGIGSLVDKSLLRSTVDGQERRFAMLETVREFAAERLAESGDAELLHRRHAEFLTQLIEVENSQLLGPDGAAALKRLDREHANLRAALQWCLAGTNEPRGELSLRIAGALWRFWCTRGHLREAQQLVDKLLAQFGVARRDSIGAAARYSAGCVHEDLAEFAKAKSLYEEALAIWQVEGNRERLADAYIALGSISLSEGDYPAARRAFDQALSLARELGDRRMIAVALSNLGATAWSQGDYVSAEAYHLESLAIRRELASPAAIAISLTSLGLIASRRDEFDKAKTYYRESLELLRVQGNAPGIAVCLNNLAEIHSRQGNPEEALRLAAEAAVLQFDAGDRLSLAYTLETIATTFRLRGEPERAVRMFGAADALRRAVGAPLPPMEEQGRNAELDSLEAALGAERYSALWTIAQTITLEAAVAEATCSLAEAHGVA